jgi:hypothetical protein
VNSNGKLKYIISIAILIVVVGVLFLAVKNKPSKSNANTGSEENTTTASDENSEEGTEATTELQVGLSDIDMNDTFKSEIDTLNSACTKFYSERKEEAQLVSEYGFLYSLSMEDNITVSKLVKEGYFNGSDEVKDYTDLLLIRPGDYAEVSGKSADGEELKVFTGFNTKDGYYVSSEGIEGTTLSEEKYNDLVFRYISSHGDITLPESTDLQYKNIVKTLNINNIDVKYIAYDEKYAVAVVAPLSDARDVREFMLEKTGDDWSIAIDGIESEKYPKQVVNAKYPDMDFGLFPAYTIADYDVPKVDMDDYVSSLRKLGLMNDDENYTYGCGTGHFVYIVTNTNKKLLGVLDDNRKLQFYQMNNVTEAKNAMLNIQKTAPTYILKYSD